MSLEELSEKYIIVADKSTVKINILFDLFICATYKGIVQTKKENQ